MFQRICCCAPSASSSLCHLKIGVLGLSFKTASLSLQESFARIAKKISGERALFFKHPSIVLLTCNRTEVYFSAKDLAEAHTDLLAFFRKDLKEAFERCLYAYFGIDCFQHLSTVASGLDSAILAETEIQRQVKLAYKRAADVIALPSCMHYVFQKSFRASKQSRQRSCVERGGSTLYGTIWSIAKEHFSAPEKKKVLLVGYSEINRNLAAYLKRRGVLEIFLATRHTDSARMEGVRIEERKLLENWQDFDWIVAAAQSEKYLIEGSACKETLIFDLSVPRNVSPDTQGAILWNIEQIDRLIEKRRKASQEGVDFSKQEILKTVSRYARLYHSKIERWKPSTPLSSGI